MSISGWMDKEDVVHIYDGVLLGNQKEKNEIFPFATMWMELDGITLGKISQRKTNIVWLHSYVEFNIQNREHKGRETKII